MGFGVATPSPWYPTRDEDQAALPADHQHPNSLNWGAGRLTSMMPCQRSEHGSPAIVRPGEPSRVHVPGVLFFHDAHAHTNEVGSCGVTLGH